MRDSRYAPIILFVYNRPDHTRIAWEALSRNAEFAQSPVYVYADAAANEDAREGVDAVRTYLQSLQHSDLHLVLREQNYGIERNEMDGISAVIENYGRAIIVEDDIEAGQYFLQYMNRALDRYANEKQVYAISAYSEFSEAEAQRLPEYGFLCIYVNWGWATWADRWHQNRETISDEDVERLRKDRAMRKAFDHGAYSSDILLQQSKAGAYTWDTIWYWVIFRNHGLVLRPARALCNNIGTDGSGVHYNDTRSKVVRKDISYCPGDQLPTDLCVTASFESALVKRNLRDSWRYKLGHNRLFYAMGIWDDK